MEVTTESTPATTTPTPAPAAPPAPVPPSERPQTGVERERKLLTPVEVDHGRSLYRQVLPGIIQAPAETILALGRANSLWPLTFGLACCAIEMIATYMSHYDLDRFGIVPWPSPRQADVMIVAGTVTKKMAPAVKLLYEQMPNPKWVISMGACATNGGPYTRYDRVLQGVDKIIPVDVYVPGCPPRPEALMDGFLALQHKIMEERGLRWGGQGKAVDTGQGEGEEEATADQQPAEPEPEEAKAEAPAPPPAKREKAEAKPPAKEPPPAGSLADLFKEVLPDVHFDAYQGVSNVIIEVPRDAIPNVMRAAKDDPRLDMSFLRCLFGVDHEAEGMEVVYELLSYEKNHTVTIKTRLAQDDLKVASVTQVWNAADWHERETRDMFGITFEGHPHLVPLLLPEDMTDHFPLRKDNPLAEIEAWQGDLLGEDVGQAGHIPSGSRSEGVSAADDEE